jgi:hypothetical protein
MCRGAVAVGGETGVTAFPVWIAATAAAIAVNTDRMVKLSPIEFFLRMIR